MYTEEVIANLKGSIAIVGGGNTPGNFGYQIDQYDNVIRVNNIRVDEYREKIGSKTTLLCHPGCDPSEWAKQFVGICPLQYGSIEVKNMLNYYKKDNCQKSYYAETNAQQNTGLNWPTTGLCLLFLFEKLKIHADVFLMDGYLTGHYYDPTVPVNEEHHNPAAEREKHKQLTMVRFMESANASGI